MYREGRFDPDIWKILDDEAPFPEAGFGMVSLARWKTDQTHLKATGKPLGLVLTAGDDPEPIAGDLHTFRVIALDFPKFADGRSYSTARLLRERFRYTGELRAVGDVLIDQIPLMQRCGFDAFAITHEPTIRGLEAGDLPDVPFYTQPIADRGEVPIGSRPWLRVPADTRQV
ncbi:MAG: DUF934 domain-containing protein [Pseudomonadota bacterium]